MSETPAFRPNPCPTPAEVQRHILRGRALRARAMAEGMGALRAGVLRALGAVAALARRAAAPAPTRRGA
jgi:hypothetical protein